MSMRGNSRIAESRHAPDPGLPWLIAMVRLSAGKPPRAHAVPPNAERIVSMSVEYS